MAFNENGEWIGFRPDFDEEDRRALEDVDRLEQAKQYRQAQRATHSYQETINNATKETLEELGISQEQWQKINQELPIEAQSKAVHRSTKKYVRKAVSAAAKRKISQGGKKSVKSTAPDPQAVSEAKSKVSQGGSLSEREQLEVLEAVLGGLKL